MSKDKKLNNLLCIDEYTEKDFIKKAKPTKRTEVAKDILEKNDVTGKDVFVEDKAKNKDEVKLKSLNNLISLDEFTEKEVLKNVKSTKRTDVAKDVLHEKKKEKEECCDDEEKPKKGLTAKQKKLPKAIQAAILKKQK